jgi:hypothetical protein
VASLDVEAFGYNEARGRVFYRDLLDRVPALPGVHAVSLADLLPPGTAERIEGVTIEGSPALRPGEPSLSVRDVSVAPGYFRAMAYLCCADETLRPETSRAPLAS